MERYLSQCVVSNCRTHEFGPTAPEYLNKIGHLNCTPEHPCLECLDCKDCVNGKAYHSSIHGKLEPKERKHRVVLSEAQKKEIISLSNYRAEPQDLAKQYGVSRAAIYRVLNNLKTSNRSL